jgi:hypothetical protein
LLFRYSVKKKVGLRNIYQVIYFQQDKGVEYKDFAQANTPS